MGENNTDSTTGRSGSEASHPRECAAASSTETAGAAGRATATAGSAVIAAETRAQADHLAARAVARERRMARHGISRRSSSAGRRRAGAGAAQCERRREVGRRDVHGAAHARRWRRDPDRPAHRRARRGLDRGLPASVVRGRRRGRREPVDALAPARDLGRIRRAAAARTVRAAQPRSQGRSERGGRWRLE